MTQFDEAVLVVVRATMEAHQTADPLAVHAALWPHVRAAVERAAPAAHHTTVPAKRDRRARPWQYIARFWLVSENGPELIAETDAEIMHGTGELSNIIGNLATQLHSDVPFGLRPEDIKPRLQQFRNNLGRASAAALRLPYRTHVDEAGGHEYLCQVDVQRIEA